MIQKSLILFCFLNFLNCVGQPFNYERAWSTYYGGENTTIVDNSSDSQGNIYIAGYVKGSIPYSNNFTTNDAFQNVYGGGQHDGFIAKFDTNGLLVWATYFGKSEDDLIHGIHIDKDDNIYIAGETSSNEMATVDAFQVSLSGSSDGFLAKFTVTGDCIWSTYFGGAGTDSLHGLDTDFLGNIYMFGKTTSTAGISSVGSFQEEWGNSANTSDGNDFIASFTDLGSLVWATYYGTNQSSSVSRITGIAVGGSYFYVGGFAIDNSASGYFATPDCFQSTNSNPLGLGGDMFLSKFALSGSRMWSTYYGGGAIERSVGGGGNGDRNVRTVAVTPTAVYLAGLSNSPNNVATSGSFQTTKQGYSNFIAKFNHDGTRIWGTYLGNTTSGLANGVFSNNTAFLTATTSDQIFVSGSTYMNDVASPNSYQSEVSTLEPHGFLQNNDSYIVKLSSDGTTREFGTYYGGYESEQGSRCLLHDDGFYILGTTFSVENISTTESHQPELDSSSINPSQAPGNAFIAKFVSTPLLTAEVTYKNSVIYPIPNNGTFNIHLNSNYIGSDLNIYDVQGKLMLSRKILLEDTTVSMSLRDGSYIIKINNGTDFSYSCKIVVKN